MARASRATTYDQVRMVAADSPFLQVPSGEWIASNRSAFAFYDRFPVSPGHALVVPRRLIGTWWEASADEKADLWTLVDAVKTLLDVSHSPDGYNVGFNAGSAAGQTIDHLHVHVIPRYQGDTPDPRGGVRLAIPERGNYLTPNVSGLFELFDGTRDRFLRLELLRCLINPEYDRIDLVVSFIMRSGLELVQDHLTDALERGAQVRVLTTDYMSITDHLALARLMDLHDDFGDIIETRVFRGGNTSFHPKSYIFWSSTSALAAGFVGSSNLSASGIGSGVEWNVGVRLVAPLRTSFDALWADTRCVVLDRDFLTTYRRDPLPSHIHDATAAIEEPDPEPVTPRPIQQEALAALEQTRISGYEAGLVTLATGLGKTWLAAFDSARPAFGRVLFIAHREEILTQSRDVFRRVHPDASLGLFHGPEKRPSARVVFASIQTLSGRLTEFEPNDFDYVVVDEFHHASAPSYRRVIDYFQPKFLLGLTATPQRMDGADLLALCHDNLVFECSLVDGIRRKELVPFEYWGVRDTVDFAPIPWRNGKFDPQALTEAVETRERAEHAFREWNQRRVARTLAFCCSITHADFMQQYFAERGVRAAAVHSGPTSSPRRETIQRLRDGELDVIFSIDVFNEGVDIPEIDTVLLLRPTDSPVIFLQQIGRGLRLCEGKGRLRVVDFIGNHRSFLTRPRVLLSLGASTNPTDSAVVRAVESGEFDLPPGCSVDYELGLVDLFRQLVRRSNTTAVEEYCHRYLEEEGIRPSAAQVLQAGFNPSALRTQHGGWHGFLASIRMLDGDEAQVWQRHGDVLRALETETINKSYKLVALRAMLRDRTLRSGAPVADVAATSRSILLADPRLVADVQTDEIGDARTVDSSVWSRWWRRWPLAHLVGDGSTTSLFRFTTRDVEWFEPRFAVADEDGQTFDGMAAEIIEWRLQRYLLNREVAETGAAVLKVNHAGGKPILMLDRGKFPRLPGGDTDFLANGDLYRGRFVKVALNVAEKLGQPGNALPALLRGWFGPSAGQPGTSHRVMLSETDGRWVMASADPIATGELTGSVIPLFADYAVACGAFSQPDVLAQRSGWLSIRGEGHHDQHREFAVFARGDSMDGGDDPIRNGDPLLFEWAGDRSAADLVGQRVLVEQRSGPSTLSTLKLLDRSGGGFVLRSTNPSVDPIPADGSMRIVARLVRPLHQGDINPLVSHVGERKLRRALGELYGMANDPQLQRSGYATTGTDAVLLVTLNKHAMGSGQHYVDAFEAPDRFTWSSQSATTPESKRGREVLDALSTGMRLHLWVRPDKDSREFEYCGLIVPVDHEGSQPIQVQFRLITPLNDDAWVRLGSS